MNDTAFENPALRNQNIRTVTLYGYRKPTEGEYGVLQCNCTEPWPVSWETVNIGAKGATLIGIDKNIQKNETILTIT